MIPHFVPKLDEDDIAAVTEALREGRLSEGSAVSELEADVAAGLGNGAHVVAASSGTAALYLSLAALDVGAGDSVVIPSYTCNSLYAAVAHAGADAICADCANGGINVSKATVTHVLRSAVKAIVVPHTCGYLADVDGIQELGIPVVEDCSHAFGVRTDDSRAMGTRATVGIVSLYATKLFPSGEGGLCITRDGDLAETMRGLRNCDERDPDRRAFNFKLSDIHAVLARKRLQKLDAMLEQRAALCARYDAVLAPWRFRNLGQEAQAVCFRYLVDTGDGNREDISTRLRSNGVSAKSPVHRPLHLSIGGACPNAEQAYSRLLSIPFYSLLTEQQIEDVIHTTAAVLAESGGGDPL